MENRELIPFSKELWETGEYEAVTGMEKPAHILEIFEHNVYFRFWNGGEWDIAMEHIEFTPLRLRKKTKKVWVPVFECNESFDSKEACDEYFSFNKFYKGAIEVEL